MKKERGFSLVELLIVLIIIGIIAGSFMLKFGDTSDKTDAVKIVSDMKTLSTASLFYFADHEEWTSNKSDLQQYIDRKLLETEKVSYDVVFISDRLYIQATLPDYSQEGIKEKLSNIAQKSGLLQKKGESMEVYDATASVVYVPVSHTLNLSAIPEKALFSSSFSSEEDLGKFTKIKGSDSWKIDQNSLVSTGRGEHRYSFGDTSWEDYEIDVAVVYDSDKDNRGGYGIYYRADGESDITGYVFQYDPGLGDRFVVRKVENGKESSPVASVKMKKVMGNDFEITGTLHNISVAVEGSQHTIKVDGVEVLSFTDDSYSQGSAGLRTWDSHESSVATFEDISVTEL